MFPLCFNWERPQPLKIDIHKDLVRAGHDREAAKRALAAYCTIPRYRETVQAGASRIDLQGQPAEAVTEREAAHARSRVQARAARPRNATPLPENTSCPVISSSP